MSVGGIYKNDTPDVNKENEVNEEDEGLPENFIFSETLENLNSEEKDDDQFFDFLSADKSKDVLTGLIYFQQQLDRRNESSLFFLQFNRRIQYVFELLSSKDDIAICIESMKLLQLYQFEDGFFLEDSILSSLTEQFMHLLRLPIENIQMDVINFLIFFGQIYFPFLVKIASSILPVLFSVLQNSNLPDLEYLEKVFELIDVTLAKVHGVSINPKAIIDFIVFLLPQTILHIQSKIYLFLTYHKSLFFDESAYITLFPAIEEILVSRGIADIELLIDFLNENQDISCLFFEQCPKIAFLIVDLIKDDTFETFRYKFFVFFNQVTEDYRYLFSSENEPFPELCMLMRVVFSNGTFKEKKKSQKCSLS